MEVRSGFMGDLGFGSFQSPTGSMTSPGSSTGWAGLLQTATSLIAPLLSSRTAATPTALAPMLPAMAGTAARALLPAVGLGVGAGLLSNLAGNGGGDELFTAAGTPRSTVPVRSPNGRMYWIGNKGAPILFAGDLRAKRRVESVAAFARRGSRPRRRFRR